MKELAQSETRVIKRSQINFNPINPKRHTEDLVKLQRKNLQKVGYMGGVIYNEVTGHLLDGHRRCMAMDTYYGYDGTNDYDIKVEVVRMDEKTEKEQTTYMAVGSTKYDIDLISGYINDIDTKDLGLSEKELNEILSLANYDLELDTFDDLIAPEPEHEPAHEEEAKPSRASEKTPENYEERKQKAKEMKQHVQEMAIEREMNEHAYITLSFSSYENKAAFCAMMGVRDDEKFIKGEDLLEMME